MEGHFSRLEQAKDRISEPEDEMEIKWETEELLQKQLKTCERNLQELTDSIKGPNMRLMGIEKGEDVLAKRICSILKKIVQKISQI
jgi:septal ring factor EnvC (AmiA/AmiB activator)